MLKFVSYDIVFQEIPSEVSLAINLSLCPIRCEGCHSPWLWEDKGYELNKEVIDYFLREYMGEITCIAFFGGDNDVRAINSLAGYIRENYKQIKIGWYSGQKDISQKIQIANFDYIKIGPYIKQLGGIKDKTTNQRLYKVNDRKELIDITYLLQRH